LAESLILLYCFVQGQSVVLTKGLTGTVFHHGRWLFDFELSCGQGCDEGSLAHERGFD